MNKRSYAFLAAALFAAPLSAARADLVLSSQVPISGSGIGAQNTVLTIQNTGTEGGCVGRVGTADVIGLFSASGGCTAATNTDVKTGSSQTQTRLLSETGVTNAANFGIVFNAVEPAGGPITINGLTATFYAADGSVLYTATTAAGATFPFASTNTGQGNSGFLFVLNAQQQAAATAAGAFTNLATTRIGLGATLSGASAGNETFFVANTGAPSTTVPEPSTYALMAAGLAGVFGFARRRNRSA